MANRGWGRGAGGYGGYMASGPMISNVGFYMGAPTDRRGMYGSGAINKPYQGVYRDDGYRRPRDEYRGGRNQKGKSPSIDKRPHHENFAIKKDNRLGKRQMPSGRYEVRIPKVPMTLRAATVPELKHMHPRISVPTDFCKAYFSWQDAYPLYKPMKLGSKTDIYILHRDVESKDVPSSTAFDVPDADYSFSVRVMLMASPEIGELYKNTCRLAHEPNNVDKTPVAKNIYFLVGGRTKTETVGIGGPWSPSLDGSNPESDPQTLINTGIRTFKSFTGIDLSSCTDWYRFMEIRYYRCANTKAPTLTEEAEEREIVDDKTEVVVFLMPYASHLVPSEEEWSKTKDEYNNTLQSLINPSDETEEVKQNEVADMEIIRSIEDNTNEAEEATEDGGKEPTHYSELDVGSLKVPELRAELCARNLDTKGVKASLVSRLQSVLEEEKKADLSDKAGSQAKSADQTPKAADCSLPKEETRDISEKDRRRLERLYRLGDKPAILVHPNRAARGGRFDCHRVSLFSLLDYRSEEQKEHNFEVSLFAEQFHEMLQRDCAFNIFKAIYTASEKDTKIDGKNDQMDTQFDEEIKESDAKRIRLDDDFNSSLNGDDSDMIKSRKFKRTVDPKLLFSFTYFDTNCAGFIRDYDLVDLLHLLDLGYSKTQMRKMVSKVVSRRDIVCYRNLTDKDVVEGDSNDVIHLSNTNDDMEFLVDLAAGNDLMFGEEKLLIPALAALTGSLSNVDLLNKVEASEEKKQDVEYKFFLIKDELDKTKTRLNSCKDFEEKLRKDNRDYQNKLKEEQRNSFDNKQLVGDYNHLLKYSRDKMTEVFSEITKQFDKEKAKKEAEKAIAAAEEEKAKLETDDSNDDNQFDCKKNEKDYEVIDQV